MAIARHEWALVLAAGEGSRLRALTTKPCGTAVPKQFCSLQGERTLLEDALARARGLIAPERICAIVAHQHRQWWSELDTLTRLGRDNIHIQPRNRGTGVGVLYSLLHIQARDPAAHVILLPADHYVRDEFLLRQSLRVALQRLEHGDERPVLLGIEPEENDPELGYILPGGRDVGGGLKVSAFVEKPHAEVAAELIGAGGLWNAFIIASSVQTIVDMYMQRYAPIVMEMKVIISRSLAADGAAVGWPAVVDMYERLPDLDFSRDLLQGQEDQLRVVRVPPCGWSDLGTPSRVARTLRSLQPKDYRDAIELASTHVNIAAQHARFERTQLSA
jgi:mannose-1-phosphate guanylyltransferase